MNYESQPLQPHELEALKSDPYAISRIIASYKLMLDFYGMRLVSLETGEVGRSLTPRNYVARYKNLIRECIALTIGVFARMIYTKNH